MKPRSAFGIEDMLTLEQKIWKELQKSNLSMDSTIVQRRNQVFVSHALMVSSAECHFQRQEEKDLRSYLVLYTGDVCGKIKMKSLSGVEYFVTFIDDKSRFVWVYPLKNKSEVFKKFSEWENTGGEVKWHEGENTMHRQWWRVFEEYLTKHGIQHELTVPKTPQQNGVAERMNRTLMENIRSMLADSKLPKCF